MTPKQTEVESARSFWEHLFEKCGWADIQVIEYIEARDAAMIEKGRREERERAVDICRKYGAVHMIDAMRGGIQ